MKATKKNEPRFQACKTLNGYAVIDTQSRTPVTPVYGVAANPNQSVDAANMVDMTKIAGMLNLMHSPVADARIKHQIKELLTKYEHFKTTQNEK
jgi:hypothetical protein